MVHGKKDVIIKILWVFLAVLVLGTAIFYLCTDDRTVPSEYQDPIRVYSIIAIFMSFVLYVLYRYARVDDLKKDEVVQLNLLKEKPVDTSNIVFVILIAGFLLRIILSVTAPQCDIDTGLFKYWGTMAVNNGLMQEYVNTNVDYPPLYIYVLFLLAKIADIFKLTDTNAYTMMVKAPSILADCGISLFIYKKYCQKMSKQWVALFMALWMFNPCVIIDSACWGQVDSILALFLLLTCHYISEKKFVWSALYLTLGILLKPQAIILTPVFFYALIKNKKFNPWWQSAVTFLVTFFTVSLPYNIKMGLQDITILGKTLKLPWIFSLYIGTADHYQYTSVNALNYWFLKGKNWVADSGAYHGLTYYKWGMIAIVAISVIVWVFYLVAKKKDTLSYIMRSLLMSVVVTFGPRMHERYFYPVILLLLVAAIKDNSKPTLGIFAITSFFGFLTIGEIMTDLLVGANKTYLSYNWPEMTPFRNILALGNVIACLLLCVYSVFYVFKDKLLDKKCLKLYREENEEEAEVVK